MTSQPAVLSVQYGNQEKCSVCHRKMASVNGVIVGIKNAEGVHDYQHMPCFWREARMNKAVVHASSFANLDFLETEDREEVLLEIEEHEEERWQALNLLKINRSKSDRSKCKTCKKEFLKGEATINEEQFNHHVFCHLKGFDGLDGNVEESEGWDDLEEEFKLKATEDITRAQEEIARTSRVQYFEKMSKDKKRKEKLQEGVEELLKTLMAFDKKKIPSILDLAREKEELAVKEMALDDEDYGWIRRFVEGSHADHHTAKYQLEKVFHVNRRCEVEDPESLNRVLLCHGTRIQNVASLLRTGLKIAPRRSVKTGAVFGHGVYFADLAGESLQYCHAKTGEKALLLLCSVSLGRIHPTVIPMDVRKETLPEEYDTIKVIGRVAPNTDGDFNHKDGYRVLMGQPHVPFEGEVGSEFPVHSNEYVVFHPERIKIKFLVQLQSL